MLRLHYSCRTPLVKKRFKIFPTPLKPVSIEAADHISSTFLIPAPAGGYETTKTLEFKVPDFISSAKAKTEGRVNDTAFNKLNFITDARSYNPVTDF
jgi:hypothetical protein